MGGCIGCIENDKYKHDILKRYKQLQDVEPPGNNKYPLRLSKREILVTLQSQIIHNKYQQTLPSPAQNQQYIQQILKKLQQKTSDKPALLKEIDTLINKFYKNEINIGEQDAAYLSTIMMNFYIQNNQNNQQVVKKYYRYAQTIYKKHEQTYFQQRIILYNNLAGYYSTFPSRRTKQKGLKYFKKTVKQIQKYMSKNDYRLLLVYNNIGCLLCELKKYKEGFENFQQCLQFQGVDQQQIQSIRENMEFYARQQQKMKYMTNNDNITQNLSTIKDENNKSNLGYSIGSFEQIN